MVLRLKLINKMRRQIVFISDKKYYVHPVFSNYAASKDGEIVNVKTGRILRKIMSDKGYYKFQVYDKNLIKPKSYYIHRFEWECIRGVIPKGFVIDHCDSVRTNNKIENLQLLTFKENVRKGSRKAIISFNIKNNEQKNYDSIVSASIELNISVTNISKICRKVKYYKSASSKKRRQ